MSMPERTIIKCEHCGGEYEFTWYRSINVSLDPELKEKVITGEIFKTTCPHCGKTSYMLFPFLYHDMEKKFMIYVDTKDRVEQGVEEQKKAQEDIKKQFPGLDLPKIEAASLDHYGRVETLINAYDSGLDMTYVDVYLTFAVKDVDRQLKDRPDYEGIENCYLRKLGDKLFVIFELANSEQTASSEFDMDLYNYIANNFNSDVEEELN